MSLFFYSIRSLWARRTDTVAALVSLALLVFVLASSSMLAAGMRHAIRSSGSRDRAIVMQKEAWAEPGSRMEGSSFGIVAAAPGLARDASGHSVVTAETVSHVMLPRSDEPERLSTLLVRGVSDNVLELRKEVRVVQGRPLSPGTEEAMVGDKLVGRYAGVELGSRIELSPARSVPVVGVFESGGSSYDSEIWIDIETARRVFTMEGLLSSVTAQLAAPGQVESLTEGLEQSKLNIAAARQDSYYEKVSGGVADFIQALGIVETLLFSIGAILGAMLTLYASVTQRRVEVGVLRALGFSRRQIIFAFLTESVALACAGAVLGLGLALLTTLIEFRTLNGSTGQEIAFYFRPDLDTLLYSAIAALLVGLASGLLPAIRAARLPPTAALRA